MELFTVAIAQHNTKFHAQVPDLPNVTVVGESIADTIDKVRGAIIEHLQILVDNNETIPKPQDINAHLINPKYAGQTWAIVSLDTDRFVSQTQVIQTNIPIQLLDKLHQHLNIPKDIHPQECQHLVENFILTAIQKELGEAS